MEDISSLHTSVARIQFHKHVNDERMRENDMDAIRRRISRTFGNRTYRSNVEGSEKANWLRIKTAVAFDRIESFLKTL